MQSAAIQIMFGAFESMSWLNHVMNVSFIKVGERGEASPIAIDPDAIEPLPTLEVKQAIGAPL